MAKAKIDQAATPSEPAEVLTPGVIPAAIAPDVPFLVRATMGGTYPNPGETLARWRDVGAVFEVKCAHDFSNRWMKRLDPDEAKGVQLPSKVIPQTTAKPRKLVPFPPR